MLTLPEHDYRPIRANYLAKRGKNGHFRTEEEFVEYAKFKDKRLAILHKNISFQAIKDIEEMYRYQDDATKYINNEVSNKYVKETVSVLNV